VTEIVFLGERLFMKFPDLSYFQSRAAEIDGRIVSSLGMDDEALFAALATAEAIVVIGRPITREMIAAAPRCRCIMTLSVGYDVVDLDAASERGIIVSNSPLYCSEEVADHAITLALTVARKIAALDEHVRGGGWDYKQARPIRAYRTRTFGIVGLGRIGRHSARKAAALGMRVVAYDPYLDDDIFALLGVERAYDLQPMLREVDICSIHTPLTDETYHLFDDAAFTAMKRDAVIVNTARGAIIDREALERALASAEIAGAGIDVLETEPPSGDEPLLGMKNAVITPHIAWYSEESHVRNMELGMDELVRILKGNRPHAIVNPHIFSRR
jgi:D-3-phosphoglycerate dehydrogenase